MKKWMQILVVKQVEKDLKKIPSKIYQRIKEKILFLANDPFPVNSKKLQDEDGLYRIRMGDYRIVYRLNPKEKFVLITKVKHRKEVYKDF